jgi:hypothetical protein
MKILRVVLLLAVLAYAGWLAWPFVSPLLEGADPGAAITRMGAEVGAGGTLTAGLWIGAVLLYLIAAGMLGAGNPRAASARKPRKSAIPGPPSPISSASSPTRPCVWPSTGVGAAVR